MTWIKTSNGGYSHTGWAVPWEEILEWQVEIYLRSCFLYYGGYEPVLSDEHHDRTEAILQAHFDELPEWLKAQVPDRNLKTAAHALVIPEDVGNRALEWLKEHKGE